MNDAELALLSIIAEGPIYGHAIQDIIAERGLRDWTNIGTSSMYYVLEKLERQGLLDSAGDSQSTGPARRQYRITPAGYGVLQTAVADLLSSPRENADGLELGLANLHVLRPSQIRLALHTYRQDLMTHLAQTREQAQQLADDTPFHVQEIFAHRAAMLEAELDWIAAFIDRWEAQAPAEEPEPMPAPADIPRMKQVILPHDEDSPHRAPTRPLKPPPKMPTRASEAQTDLSLTASSAKETVTSSPTPPDLGAALHQSPHTAANDNADDDHHADGEDMGDLPRDNDSED